MRLGQGHKHIDGAMELKLGIIFNILRRSIYCMYKQV